MKKTMSKILAIILLSVIKAVTMVTTTGDQIRGVPHGYFYGFYNPEENKFIAISDQPVSEEIVYTNPHSEDEFHRYMSEQLPHGEIVAYTSPELTERIAGPETKKSNKSKEDSDSEVVIVSDRKSSPPSKKTSGKEKDDDKPKKNKSKKDEENGIMGCSIAAVLIVITFMIC
ncbi:hypothetical protein H311_03268 [Anncaliia algerae PRA109]|nr:hypothetical protein H311_03268 [Anncaliia algerae PRA109]